MSDFILLELLTEICPCLITLIFKVVTHLVSVTVPFLQCIFHELFFLRLFLEYWHSSTYHLSSNIWKTHFFQWSFMKSDSLKKIFLSSSTVHLWMCKLLWLVYSLNILYVVHLTHLQGFRCHLYANDIKISSSRPDIFSEFEALNLKTNKQTNNFFCKWF